MKTIVHRINQFSSFISTLFSLLITQEEPVIEDISGPSQFIFAKVPVLIKWKVNHALFIQLFHNGDKVKAIQLGQACIIPKAGINTVRIAAYGYRSKKEAFLKFNAQEVTLKDSEDCLPRMNSPQFGKKNDLKVSTVIKLSLHLKQQLVVKEIQLKNTPLQLNIPIKEFDNSGI